MRVLKEGEYFGQNLRAYENNLFKLSVTSYEKDSQVEKHYHENNYLSILVAGHYTETSCKDESLVISGDILYRPKDYTHQNLFTHAGGTCFNIEFKPDWEKYFDHRLRLPAHYTHFKAGSFPGLYRLLTNFNSHRCEDLYLETLCDWYFRLNRVHITKGVLPWMDKVSTILEQELDSFHSLASLSERVFVHPVYLARAFKERKGITIGEYQLHLKLSNAVSLLLNSSLSMSAIAFRNGFFDDAHFIRSFKSAYGLSPSRFRLLAKS